MAYKENGKLQRRLKLDNEYSNSIGELFERTPKAVFAALAVSFAMRIFGEDCDVPAELREEWRALWANHIIPQCPPRIKTEVK
jgi:hypothetical protein